MVTLIDGKKLAAELKAQLHLVTPQGGLGVIVVGNDPASAIYIEHKQKLALELHIPFKKLAIHEDTDLESTKNQIKQFVNDPELAGIILQLPLPPQFPVDELLNLIPRTKDVDGLLPGSPFVSATARAVMHAIQSTGHDLTGKHAVLVGYSRLLGKALVDLLINAKCTVSITHIHTQDLASITRQGDIVVSAVGKPDLIRGDMIKDGCIAIDVGITRTEQGIKGDINFAEASKKAAYITPVPGGIGPLTVLFLMANTLGK